MHRVLSTRRANDDFIALHRALGGVLENKTCDVCDRAIGVSLICACVCVFFGYECYDTFSARA